MRASGARTIVVNDQYLVAPWADICYFADFNWWKWHTAGLAKKWAWAAFTADAQREAFREFAGQKCTIENTGGMVADPEVFMLHNYGHQGLSEQPNGVHTGSNGGYQAVNIATLAGPPKKILLLAYDMQFPGGKTHGHNGHPLPTPEDRYLGYARNFKSMLPQLAALGVEVVNCTPKSRIDCFRFGDLEKELAAPATSVAASAAA